MIQLNFYIFIISSLLNIRYTCMEGNMDTIYNHLTMFTDFLDLLENHFGPNSELVLHDNNKPQEDSIVDIRNGHITGRKIGNNIELSTLETFNQVGSDMNTYNKIIHMRNGKVIRSSSICLQDKATGKAFTFCINTDITDSLKCEEYLKILNNYTTPTSHQEVFTTDVNELLENLLLQCENMFEKSIGQLNKEEKLEVIKFLDDKNAFLITKSGDRVCEFLNISKFTLYNYLDMTRKATAHK